MPLLTALERAGAATHAPERAAQYPAWAHPWAAPLLVGLAAYAIAVAAAMKLLNDGDTLSHIALGRWIIAHHALPFNDPFTYTLPGHSWVPHEWLAEIVFAAIWRSLGWGGIVSATAGAIGATFALLTRALQSSLGPRRAVIGAALAFLLSEGHLLARPHVLALPLLVIWMAGLVRARDEDRVPSRALLPVMVLWCNLHGGFVVGLLFAALLAAEAVLDAAGVARPQVARGWGGFLGLAGLSALVSPNGISAILLPFRMVQMNFALSSITEWHSADFSGFDPLLLWIGLAVAGGFSLGLRLPWPRILMVLLLLYLALSHVRNEELLGIIAPLLVAAPLARQLASTAAPAPTVTAQDFRRRSMSAPLILAATIVPGLVATAATLDRRGLDPPGSVAPAAAVRAAQDAGLGGRVFNSVRFGGYLIFIGIPTFVDGRTDLFGDAFLERYVAAASAVGEALPDLLDRYAVGWTLLEPQSPAVSLLDHLPGWERLYADAHAVVHRRQPPPTSKMRH
jgi:hypothetical protein